MHYMMLPGPGPGPAGPGRREEGDAVAIRRAGLPGGGRRSGTGSQALSGRRGRHGDARERLSRVQGPEVQAGGPAGGAPSSVRTVAGCLARAADSTSGAATRPAGSEAGRFARQSCANPPPAGRSATACACKAHERRPPVTPAQVAA